MITSPTFQPLCNTVTFLVPPTFLGSSAFLQNPIKNPCRKRRESKCYRERLVGKRRGEIVCWALLPVDPWAPNIDSQSIASQLFAFSLFPYLGFLYFITKSKSAPKLTLFGFYFLLAFVGATSEFSQTLFLLSFLCDYELKVFFFFCNGPNGIVYAAICMIIDEFSFVGSHRIYTLLLPVLI